jgi:hypothetical protein
MPRLPRLRCPIAECYASPSAIFQFAGPALLKAELIATINKAFEFALTISDRHGSWICRGHVRNAQLDNTIARSTRNAHGLRDSGAVQGQARVGACRSEDAELRVDANSNARVDSCGGAQE